jgi:hypothetical protein
MSYLMASVAEYTFRAAMFSSYACQITNIARTILSIHEGVSHFIWCSFLASSHLLAVHRYQRPRLPAHQGLLT